MNKHIVDEIVEGGFWKRDTRDTFIRMFNFLMVEGGATAIESKEMLENIYYAVASEFGG